MRYSMGTDTNDLLLEISSVFLEQFRQLPLYLSPNEAADAVGCCESTMYNLMHTEDFPTTILNKRKMVRKDFLIKYMNSHTQNCSFWDQYQIKDDRQS